MYLPQTYRGKSALCAGAGRGVEAGAGGQGCGTANRGESGFGETMQIAPLYGGVEKFKEKTMANKKIWLGILVMVLALGSVTAQTLSTEQLAREVQASIVTELDKHFRGGMEVTEELNLIKRTGNEYVGSMYVEQNGWMRGGELDVVVIYDGESFQWRAATNDNSWDFDGSYAGRGRIISSTDTDSALNGTWGTRDSKGGEAVYVFNNGNYETKITSGNRTLLYRKGTYTANNGQIVFNQQQFHGTEIGLEPRWYTMRELRNMGAELPGTIRQNYSISGKSMTIDKTTLTKR